MDVPSLLTLCSGAVDLPVCKEHRHEFKYFCKSHMVELCLTCRRMEHKNCTTVINIEQAAREIYTESHGCKIIQSVKQLLVKFGEWQVTARESKSKLHSKRQAAIDSVKHTRKSIDPFPDRQEAHVLTDIDEILDKEKETLDEQINICNASIAFLTASLSSLNRWMSAGNNKEKFVEINKATKQIKRYCSMLRDLSHELCEIDIKFEENEVSNLNILLRDLGKCSVIRSPVSSGIMDTEPVYSGEIQLTTNKGLGERDHTDDSRNLKGAAHSCDKTPAILSFDILPDGRQLLMDLANKILKLYDRNNFLVMEYVLSVNSDYEAFYVVVLSNSEAVVSTCTNTLLKVKIGDGLAVTETKSKHIIGPIQRWGVDIIAVMLTYNAAHVSVLDKDFTLKKTIMNDDNKTLFKAPLCLAASDDRSMLFVTDSYNGCFGCTIDGKIQCHYQVQGAKRYFGVAVGKDCLFLGAKNEKGEYHVQKLNLSGESIACTDFGLSWPLRVIDNELVLCTRADKGNTTINFYFLFH